MIKVGMFKGLGTAEKLSVANNVIEDIDDESFIDMRSCLELDLKNNMLSIIKKGTLVGLDKLKKLGLLYNRISSINQLHSIIFLVAPAYFSEAIT